MKVDKDRLLRLQHSFKTDRAIADELGVLRHVVTNLRKLYGIVAIKNRNSKRNEKIIWLKNKGRKVGEIAREIFLCENTIRRVIKRGY